MTNKRRWSNYQADQDAVIWVQRRKVYAEGVIQLPVTFGIRPAQVTQMVDFLLVNQPSTYNAIIGRPTLNALRAVVSTYHLAMKFPIEDLVGKVRGDQAEPR